MYHDAILVIVVIVVTVREVMVAWCVIRLMRMYLIWERVDYLQLPVAMVYGLKLEPSTHASCVLGGTAKWPVAQDSLSPCVGMKPA